MASDVVLNSGSTTVIDAACLNRPDINIAFDGYETNEIENRSVRRLLVKEHYKPIIESGGVRMAYNRQELITEINRYLADPSLDTEGRQKIVADQCYRLDGLAGTRIAQHIITSLGNIHERNTTK